MSLQARGNPLRENTKENQKGRQNMKAGNNGKRNALGNVTNQVRRQPLRAAKDKHTLIQGTSKSGFGGQENEAPPKNMGGFAIFEDARVPSYGVSAHSEQPQVLSSRDVSHIDDELMQEKENLQEEAVLPDSIINLQNVALPAPLGLLQPLRIDVDNSASPMAVDISGRESRGEGRARDEFGIDPYSSDIYTFLRAREVSSRPGIEFMNRQTDVSMSMRNILVDWLIEVGEEYKLHRETLFLSINYIDRFLSLVRVERPKLQLVGTASMFIAAKYEEIYPPDVGEFVYITDDTYTKKQVLKMESVILKLLEFKVAAPTVNWFIEHFLENFHDMSDTAKFLAFFFAELSLIEAEDFLTQRSSVIAASCIVLARSTLNMHPVWPNHLEHASSYSVSDLLDCVKTLYSLYKRTSSMPQQAVVEKYKQEKFGRVSFIPPSGVLTLL